MYASLKDQGTEDISTNFRFDWNLLHCALYYQVSERGGMVHWVTGIREDIVSLSRMSKLRRSRIRNTMAFQVKIMPEQFPGGRWKHIVNFKKNTKISKVFEQSWRLVKTQSMYARVKITKDLCTGEGMAASNIIWQAMQALGYLCARRWR